MARHQQWHISGWAAYVLAPFAIIVAIAVQLVVLLFGLKNSEDLTAEDVASYLEASSKAAVEIGTGMTSPASQSRTLH